MKNFFLSALVAVAAISGTAGYFNQPVKHELNALALANLEALTDIELPDLTIECSAYNEGECCAENFLHPMVMCGEYMFYPCKFTGDPSDYCQNPC